MCVFIFAELFQAKRVYSQQILIMINLGLQSSVAITVDFQQANSIPVDIARPPDSTWIVIRSIQLCRRQRERRQK